MFGGFRERADADLRAAARTPGRRSSWWPHPSATRCARRPTSSDRLDEERMPLAGLVVNRMPAGRRAGAERPHGRWRRPSSSPTPMAGRRRPGDAPRRGCCACTPPWPRRPPGSERLAARFTAGHPGVPGGRGAGRGPGHPRPRRACARSAPPSRPRRGADAAGGVSRRSASRARVGSASALSVAGGSSRRRGPGGDVGAALEQGPALTLGHPTPHAELGAVVEGVGEALGDDRAAAGRRPWPVCWAAPWTNSASGSEEPRAPRCGPVLHPAGAGSSGRCRLAHRAWSRL